MVSICYVNVMLRKLQLGVMISTASLVLIGCKRDEPHKATPASAAPPKVSVGRPIDSLARPPSWKPAPSRSAASPLPTPERLAAKMQGTIRCGKQKCRAGKEVCVSAPSEDYQSHCEAIRRWDKGITPVPKDGAPPMAGITGCNGSHQCPEGSVCCLHEVGMAVVQAAVCHAELRECRDREELCDKRVAGGCRTPGTRCDEWRCVAVSR